MKPFSFRTLVVCSAFATVACRAWDAEGTTIISTLPFTSAQATFSPFGLPNTATYGETISVPSTDHFLTSFTFYVEHASGGPVLFDAYVFPWDGQKASGPALFSSALAQTLNNSGIGPPETFNFNTGNLALTPSGEYVLAISASGTGETGVGYALAGNTRNTGGTVVWDNNGNNLSLLTSQTWTETNYTTIDFAIQATFVPEPSTWLLGAFGGAGLCFWRLKRRRWAKMLACAAAVLPLLAPLSARAALVNYAWSTVGDPGNAADPTTGLGNVANIYNIGTYDVTTAQYTAFLNAVAASDPYGLWNSGMIAGLPTVEIVQDGISGNYSYSVIGNPNAPAFDITWSEAARFANWMQNGQPPGPEGPGTTETGAYTLNGAVTPVALMNVARNPNATIFLPSENEWYKAAYYKGGGTKSGYWLYPTQSNTAPSNALSATGTNNANYYTFGFTDPTNYVTSVGAFADSPGPYGTYDMGGDVWQWDEAGLNTTSRGLRGGSFGHAFANGLPSSANYGVSANMENNSIGFRLASLPVPEPGSVTLLLLGAAGLLFWRRRRAL